MDNSKKLTPEEMVEVEENATWAYDQLQLAQEELVFFKDQSRKKDALLKEAIVLLRELNDGDVIGPLGGLLSVYSVKVHDFLSKTTGKEAGE